MCSDIITDPLCINTMPLTIRFITIGGFHLLLKPFYLLINQLLKPDFLYLSELIRQSRFFKYGISHLKAFMLWFICVDDHVAPIQL